jgi:chromosome partitioning protein
VCLLIDADPQGSALDWAACRTADPLFPVIGFPKPKLHKEVPAHIPHYDHIIIDGPPRVNELARSAIMAADWVVIPVQPSPYDVWAAKDIVDLIREATTYRESIKSVFVINRRIVNTAIGRDVAEALAGYDIPGAGDAYRAAGGVRRKRGQRQHGAGRRPDQSGEPGNHGPRRGTVGAEDEEEAAA